MNCPQLHDQLVTKPALGQGLPNNIFDIRTFKHFLLQRDNAMRQNRFQLWNSNYGSESYFFYDLMPQDCSVSNYKIGELKLTLDLARENHLSSLSLICKIDLIMPPLSEDYFITLVVCKNTLYIIKSSLSVSEVYFTGHCCYEIFFKKRSPQSKEFCNTQYIYPLLGDSWCI